MKITIYQDENGNPVVSVQGETPKDSPEKLAKTYLQIRKLLKEDKSNG